MKCNDMKCKLKESIQLKIDVSIYLFFCWFYYFKVTRIRETITLKLNILLGRTPRPPLQFGNPPYFRCLKVGKYGSSPTVDPENRAKRLQPNINISGSGSGFRFNGITERQIKHNRNCISLRYLMMLLIPELSSKHALIT